MTLNNSNLDSNKSSPAICASKAYPYNKQSHNTIYKTLGQSTVPETKYLPSREPVDTPVAARY